MPKPLNSGLSQLQKQILELARRNGGQVFARDVLIHFYEFRPFRNVEDLKPGAIIFRKSDIGPAKYNSANIAVCKAFNRLCDRRMAIRIHGGIKLKNG